MPYERLSAGVFRRRYRLRGSSRCQRTLSRLFLVTGVLGGFTTFSAFSLEVGLLYERGQLGAAMLYAISSVVCAVGAMFLGMHVVRNLGVT